MSGAVASNLESDLSQFEVSASPMPDGPIEGPSAWRGEDMARSQEWLVVLDVSDQAELLEAVRNVIARQRPLIAMTPDDFVLPRLGERLQIIKNDLLRGRGFVLVRGLPVTGLDREEIATLYVGLGAHLGKMVSQNGRGHLLGHVIDVGRDEDDPTARIYQTNARQFYHADSCDFVGLLCLRKAREGGLSTILSSVTLYNEMLKRAPDLVGELFQPFHVDRRGEVPPGMAPWYHVPMFNWHAGLLTTYYVRRYIVSARRLPGVPPLTDRQIAALDAFDAISEDPSIHLSMEFEPGDMQFLHNHQILHDRTAFKDWPNPDERRHLLRLWLCPPEGRSLPPAYKARWQNIEPGNRGGILCEGTELTVPLDPA
jgi:hypothetical protein